MTQAQEASSDERAYRALAEAGGIEHAVRYLDPDGPPPAFDLGDPEPETVSPSWDPGRRVVGAVAFAVLIAATLVLVALSGRAGRGVRTA
ncbi:MAG: hypothetical protein ACFBWO_08455, partial [Paracoccaceae bacterium]